MREKLHICYNFKDKNLILLSASHAIVLSSLRLTIRGWCTKFNTCIFSDYFICSSKTFYPPHPQMKINNACLVGVGYTQTLRPGWQTFLCKTVFSRNTAPVSLYTDTLPRRREGHPLGPDRWEKRERRWTQSRHGFWAGGVKMTYYRRREATRRIKQLKCENTAKVHSATRQTRSLCTHAHTFFGLNPETPTETSSTVVFTWIKTVLKFTSCTALTSNL